MKLFFKNKINTFTLTCFYIVIMLNAAYFHIYFNIELRVPGDPTLSLSIELQVQRDPYILYLFAIY